VREQHVAPPGRARLINRSSNNPEALREIFCLIDCTRIETG
jgi:hypothetical protein